MRTHHFKRLIRLMPAIALVGAIGCKTPAPAEAPERLDAPAPARSLELLNATLWAQQGAEARGACHQAYSLATARLDVALTDRTWTAADEQSGAFADLPPAVILDVDETVLDNSYFEARVAKTGRPFSPESFAAWVAEARAPGLPGAQEFCTYARSKGVTVFYVTNRSEAEKAKTRQNLIAQGFPMDPEVDTVICKTDVSDKGPRRAAITVSYRVLLLVGDNATDFSSAFVDQDNAIRLDVASTRRGMWGTRWIIVPNAMYGDWEKVQGGRSVENKLDALRTDP